MWLFKRKKPTVTTIFISDKLTQLVDAINTATNYARMGDIENLKTVKSPNANCLYYIETKRNIYQVFLAQENCKTIRSDRIVIYRGIDKNILNKVVLPAICCDSKLNYAERVLYI